MGLSPQNNLINGLKGRLFSKNGQKKIFKKIRLPGYLLFVVVLIPEIYFSKQKNLNK
jgi:hypothetical protein